MIGSSRDIGLCRTAARISLQAVQCGPHCKCHHLKWYICCIFILNCTPIG